MNLPTKILPLLLTLSPLLLFSQTNPQPHFRNYSTQHGLPSPEVYCAFQDSRGYMWFGTDNGAARFDGYTFRTYDAQDGLTSNVVFDIHEDAKGRIWFGTMTGEAFILNGDTILPYRFNHLVQQYQSRYSTAGLGYLSQDCTAYFELEQLGILVIDNLGKDSLITTERPLSHLIFERQGLPKLLKAYIRRREEEAWKWDSEYIRRNQGLQYELASDTGRFKIELKIHGSATIFNAQRLSDDQVLFCRHEYLYCLQGRDITWSVPFVWNINEIIEDKEGKLWLCMAEGQGLRRYHSLNALKNGEYDLFLNGLSISDFYLDTQGGLWITTQEQGVFYCNDMQLLTYDSRFGLSDEFVSSVTFKNEKELFAGCENGDIFQLNLDRDRIERTIINSSGYHNFDLIYQPEKDVLWNNGAYWKDGRWHFLYSRNSLNKLRPFKALLLKQHLNDQGDLLGCNGSGIYIFDVKNDTAKFNSLRGTHLRERTFALHTDRQQRLWVGNARGLFQFKDSILLSPGIAHPAFNHRVEDIDELPDSGVRQAHASALVFGTKGWGVVRWKGEGILQITTDDGLTANMIEDVHVDENGILWVGTLNGLNKVTFGVDGRPSAYEPPPTPPKEGSRPSAIRRPTVRRFTVANGLPSNEIYKVKSYAGQVWLCTAGGLVKFHEPDVDTLATAPVIQYLRANGADVPLAANKELQHNNNSLEFRFLAINYRQNGRIPYRYRLNEKADWQYTENLTVNYPQLPPGA
ncbi:MAG: hypothetical protein KDD01_16565, partial [Phaeodactylibacter sp.]|nr:hypothetical protein [Phaeodactylibacter sp.]